MSATETASDAENPLIAGLERLPVHPTALVIFGATGDLARRKLLPALYNLAHEGALPERFSLVGNARSEMTDAQFGELAIESIREFSRRPPDEKVLGNSSTTCATCRARLTTSRSTSNSRRSSASSTRPPASR